MARSERHEGESRWWVSVFGALVLIAPGFLLGLVVGIAWEEPELIAGHFAGRTEEVSWLPQPEEGLPDEPLGTVSSAGAGRRESARSGGLVEAEFAGPSVPHEIAIELPSVAAAPYAVELPPVAAPPAARSVDSLPSAAEPVARTAPGDAFAVQVGAFAESAAAERVRDHLQRKGFDVYLVSARRSGDGRARVRVGPVESRAEADALADRLKREERLPTWVMSGQ